MMESFFRTPSCFCGATEIRTRDTLLGYTRFPGMPLFVLPACKSDFSFSLLWRLRVYCANSKKFLSRTACAVLHICGAKLRTFNHICKFLTSFFIERRSESSSTIESKARSSKCGQDNTPSLSARRYTRLKSWALSLVVVGRGSGITVSNRHPHPEHSFVRRHHSDPVRSRQQSFMFEHIFEFS